MLHTVILAGGSGTRFWPLSRRDRPKQFLKLAGSRSMIQQSFDRVSGLTPPGQVWVVTSEGQAAGVAEHLPELPAENLIVEPQPRDTAIAMGIAAGVIGRSDPKAVLAVTPSDHVIRPAARFRELLKEASQLAQGGGIVTCGIPPRSPHTGYGYIHRGAPIDTKGRANAFAVEAFTEKPELATAEAYLAGGEHYWNSGIFVWTARTLLDSLAEHLPRTHQAIEAIVAAWSKPARDEVLRSEYEAVERISIDYAVLEKASRVTVLEADFEWSDVGSWAAVPALFSQDEVGNTVQQAPVAQLEARDCLVVGDGRLVALIGVSDLMVIQTRDATLICPRDRAEDVKRLVQGFTSEELEPYT